MITGTDRPVSVCIGCGCDDNHACRHSASGEACSWLAVDRRLGRGVCSACPRKLAAWRKGKRELSEPARVAIEMRNLAEAGRRFDATVKKVKARNAEVPAGKIEAEIDEALRAVRATKRKPPIRCPEFRPPRSNALTRRVR